VITVSVSAPGIPLMPKKQPLPDFTVSGLSTSAISPLKYTGAPEQFWACASDPKVRQPTMLRAIREKCLLMEGSLNNAMLLHCID
jgi:hypothetical protein